MGDIDDRVRGDQYRKYLNSELEAAAIYAALAEMERESGRAEIFQDLVRAEMRHAARWARKLGINPNTLEPQKSRFKARLVKWMAGLLGTGMVLLMLSRVEAKGVSVYAADPEAQDIAKEERRHARVLRGLGDGLEHTPGAGGWRRGVLGGSGSIRAAVLGVNDGLVSNFSLVMGVAAGTANVAGGTGNAEFVLLAGVAGLLAGAFSMGAGEYVSMRSQRDIYEHELRKERIEIQEWPEEEEKELQLIYRAKGLSEAESRRVARRVMENPDIALDTMAREGLGLDPAQLGSPWAASISSFVSFVAGAVVPIMPYIFNAGSLAFSLSAVLSVGALVGVGGLLAALSGRNLAWGALRMLLAGGTAATVTFSVGSLIRVSGLV